MATADRPYIDFMEVKAQVPLLDVLPVFDLAEHFQPDGRSGKRYAGCCPFPSHEHGPRPNAKQFKISLKDELWLWHCFGDCSAGGDVIEFVKRMTGLDNSHVRFWFAEHFADRLGLSQPEKQTEAKPDKKKAKPTAADGEHEQGEPLPPLGFTLKLDLTPYIAERGVSDQTAERYGLGLCKKGQLAGYLAIPVHDHRHGPKADPVGYVGRWPGEDFEAKGESRYKVPAGFETGRVVYGVREALAGTADYDPLIVVEGPFKVYFLAQEGYAAVSTFTASVSDDQAAILAETGRPIVLMFDGNESGYAGMRAAAARLITRAFLRAVKLPEGIEADSDRARQLLALSL